MTSIAELGIRVDSTDAAQASTDLDKMTAAGGRAEKATESLGESSDQAKARILALGKEAIAAAEAQKGMANTATGLSEAQQGLITSSSGSAQAQAQLSSAQRATVVTTDRLAVSTTKATTVTSTQQAELQQLLEQIDPTTKALNRLDEQERKLAQQKKLGLEPEVFSVYQGKIQQTRESLTRFDDSLTRTGNTAKQTAAALRGVPAQATDIFTSLIAGQPAMMVLLQQGGQLKDQFGGIGAAAKALGGYALGLVNPFTVAAASVASLGLAYYKGSEEADAYSEALILSGNVAGTSAAQLANMARQVSTTVGTTGAAAEVLAKLAGNGKIASESFGQITEAALQMERATGKAIDDTIAEFAKIAKDPVAAAKELNDQYHFLTASVYSQITALKEQGDTVGAAKLLTDTYASTVATRAGQITQNLGYIQRGWNEIRDAAKGALDATYDIGRDKTLKEQVDDLKAKLTGSAAYDVGGLRMNAGAVSPKERAEIQEQIRLKEIYIEIEKRQNKYVGERQKIQDKGIEAEQDLERIRVASYSNKQKRDKEEESYLRKIASLREANPNSPLLDQKNIDRDLKNIRDKYKDPKGASTPVDLTSFNDSKNQLNAVLSYYKSADKELEAAQKAGIISQEGYTAQRVALLQQQASEVKSSYEAEISSLEDAKGKAGTSAAQRIQLDHKIADARANMVKAQQESDSELKVIDLEETGRLARKTAATEAYVDQLERQRRALSLSGDRAAASLGMGDREAGRERDLDASRDRFNEERAKLLDRRKTAPDKYSQADYEKDLASLESAEGKYRDTVLENYDKISEAQADWRKGATSGFRTYLESARDLSGQAKSLVTGAFGEMEDSLANFATSGKLSFSDFTKSIISDMARIATRQAASGLLSSLAGTALGSWLGGGGGATTSFGSSIGSAITANAKGGVYDSPSLSSFSNQVHDKPQMFAFAKGDAIFAEAGPEAIMPLTRTAGGELGVRALSGGGGSGGSGGSTESKTEVTININRDGSGDSTADTAMGKSLAPQFLSLIRGEIAANERRTLSPSGGATWRAINGR
ncbi:MULTISPECIES: phage tail tape measure protein [Pseudomonas]|jgi:lambda family phage tail tape measure protein|uniref:Phage tail tape measure protein n=1 Tax=Pseudomonas haemolytica TaxID=2600065 RepID=A0A646NZM2_9PSED|nr:MULTISPECIES: phage tail tape measure protein [Pseudomonas]MBV2083031.1 phage tail tape measure protein [Pseudomonas carnis]MBV2085129.1 phage tail tape measure protein [Pseudomonas carnis]MDO3688684.1 phage tail tape measure protein [Pseudomonas sp. DKN 2791]MDO7034769.1 phage tail tape measure protein [Pseudomonas sp. DKN 2792]MRJ21354.1 phage tail tape measure protein [Pseudomonas haemolytica]